MKVNLAYGQGHLPVDLPETEGPYLGGVGRALGVPTYGVGLVDLKASLEALFRLF